VFRLRLRLQLVVALGLAAVTAYNVHSYLGALAAHAQVVVASAPLEAGTVFTPGLLRTVTMHVSGIHPHACRDRSQLLGRVTLWPLLAGEQVLLPKTTADPGHRGMAGTLGAEQRAVYIPAAGFRGLAGAVVPGERVDLVWVAGDLRPGLTDAVTVVEAAVVLDVRDERGARYTGSADALPAGLLVMVSPAEALHLTACLKAGTVVAVLAPYARRE
jgi:pilus assembly protein CpaB